MFMWEINSCVIKKIISDFGINYRYTIYHLINNTQLDFYFINGLGKLDILDMYYIVGDIKKQFSSNGECWLTARYVHLGDVHNVK